MNRHLLLNVRNFVALLVICFGAPIALAEQEPETFRDCGQCPEMVGLPEKGFAIGKYEVTFDEWDACLADGGCNGYKPGEGKKAESWGRGDRPVIYVSWEDAQAYTKWLSRKTGKDYRLPNEEEWEYACYGGEPAKYCGGEDLKLIAWFDANSQQQTHPVGQKQPNGYGVYDMTGNVWEWTNGCWGNDCTIRKVRGGGWLYGMQLVQATTSLRFLATVRSYSYGFRLARPLP